MLTVAIDIPQDIAETFQDIDELRRTLYQDFIIDQRQQGKISLGRAAELLGMTYREFFELLGKKGFSFINASPEELQQSYAHFTCVMETNESK